LRGHAHWDGQRNQKEQTHETGRPLPFHIVLDGYS
jgi:hypothetical protein